MKLTNCSSKNEIKMVNKYMRKVIYTLNHICIDIPYPNSENDYFDKKPNE